jgi:hypothetical protein
LTRDLSAFTSPGPTRRRGTTNANKIGPVNYRIRAVSFTVRAGAGPRLLDKVQRAGEPAVGLILPGLHAVGRRRLRLGAAA